MNEDDATPELKWYAIGKLWPLLVSLGSAMVMLLAFFIPSVQDQWDRYQSREVIQQDGLPFAILSDTERRVIALYGLAHEDAGLAGETIAIPAEILLRPDGSIAWQHSARRITERASPSVLLAEIDALAPGPAPVPAR